MGNIEQIISEQGHNEALQQARNATQIELAHESGQDLVTWIGEHANDFGKLMSENPTILERLASNDTHSEALEEVKKEIYH